MRADGDLLNHLADEHRDLTTAVRGLRQLAREQRDTALRGTAARIVEHELIHRLLIHPLLRRESWGRRIFTDRREEQLLLGERLRRILTSPNQPSARWGAVGRCEEDDEASLDLQLVEHTDREEILEFPHLRHVSSAEELAELGRVQTRLRSEVRARLNTDPSLIDQALWATTPRRELPELLELPEDLVIVLPEAGGRESNPRGPSLC